MFENKKLEKLFYFIVTTSIVLGLWICSLNSYLLFHSLIEIITVAIGFTLFMMMWNARKFIENNFLIILGIGYLFIAIIDMFHTLAYKGMNVFSIYSTTNIAAQLWVSARALQAGTLCIAPLLMRRKVNNIVFFIGFTLLDLLLLLSVFSGNFPDCYIDGKGLTSFKIFAEYIIVAFFLLSYYILYRKRNFFSDNVLNFIMSSIICSIISEMFFTSFVSFYDFANMAGHIFKMAAFYLIYKSILVTGLKEPFNLIFRELQQAKETIRKAYDSLEEKVSERTTELRESELRYRDLFENSPVSLWEEDFSEVKKYIDSLRTSGVLDFREYFENHPEEVVHCVNLIKIVDVNQATLTLYKADNKNQLFEGLNIVFGKESFDIFQKELLYIVNNGNHFQSEAVQKNLYDEIIYVVIRFSIAPGYEKTWEKIFVSITDITERKLTEEALHESEWRYREIFDNVLDSLFLLEVSTDGHFRNLEVNPAFEKSTGLAREQLIGKFIEETVPPEVATIVNAKYRHCVESGHPVEEEALLDLPTGKRYYHSTLIPAYDQLGRIYRIIGISRDITEHKRAEKIMREQEEQFKRLVEYSPVAMIATQGVNEEVIIINRKFTDLFGYSVEDIPNVTYWWPLAYPNEQYREEIKTQWSIVVENTTKHNIENKPMEAIVMCKDGSQKDIEFRFSSIGEKNLVTLMDLTDRKQSEEKLKESNRKLEEILAKLKETQKQILQQEKMRSLGQLASGIAHDINNSLTPIMGYIDMLSDDSEVMKTYANDINMIIKCTKNITRTIGRMREFYKIKLTEEDLKEKNINDVINSTIELTKHKWKNIAESTGSIIEIKKEFQDDLPLIRIDESEIIEAITNLILNACDALPNGGTLTFNTCHKENDIVIKINDTGSGMSDDILNQCINPFFTTKGDKGTGLGLAMVYGVIERHNGEIKISSKPNEGTSISLSLPIIKGIKEEEKIEDIVKKRKPLKILCVDDDIAICDMLKKMLEKNEHKVVQAFEGKLGIDLYKKSLDEKMMFDLVLTDLGMPGLDGITFSKEIKRITPDVPIILLTGWGSFMAKEEYPTIDYLLKKPITRQDLSKAINALFKDK